MECVCVWFFPEGILVLVVLKEGHKQNHNFEWVCYQKKI